jgi:hypothetical protein
MYDSELGKVFRGLAKRIRRIMRGGNRSLEMGLLLLWLLFLLFVLVPWMLHSGG